MYKPGWINWGSLMSNILKYISITILVGNILFIKGVAQPEQFDKIIFQNALIDGAYYFSNVEYSGSSWIKNIQGKLPVNSEISFTPGNALELTFKSSDKGSWKVKLIYDKIRGIDRFTQADHLSFWLYGNSGIEKNALPFMSLSYPNEEGRSAQLPIGDYVEKLPETDWIRVLIPLKDFAIDDLDIKKVEGLLFINGQPSDTEQQIFLDQMEFIQLSESENALKAPEIQNVKGYEKHFDITWEKLADNNIKYVKIHRAIGNQSFEAVGIQIPGISGYSDYTGFHEEEVKYKLTFLDHNYNESPYSIVKSSKTKEMADEELLDMIQQANLRYYWEGAEPNSGMALENIPGRKTMIATGASGFGMMAILAGVKRGFISREKAVERFLKITDFLSKADRFHGVFPHFLDGRTGKTVPFFGNRDNGGDLVETSFLMQGLLTARQYFDRRDKKEAQIRKTITTLWEDVEWDWYRKNPNSDFLYWHWSPDQEWVLNHKLIGWNETMITYFLAIASPTHGVPSTMYYTGWASQADEARAYRSNWGKTSQGSMYTNGTTYYGIKLPVGVSNGGPLFFIHYSFLGLNPQLFADKYVDYFDNNKKIAEINQRYCIENPEGHKGYGADFWGLTASDGPEHYAANEPKTLQDNGKMTPTGALASFPYMPDASMQALKNYYRNYGNFLYGYYGFSDALNLDKNWVAPIYMGLNQAPIVVMIENYRSGFLWELFMSNEEVKNAIDSISSATKTKYRE